MHLSPGGRTQRLMLTCVSDTTPCTFPFSYRSQEFFRCASPDSKSFVWCYYRDKVGWSSCASVQPDGSLLDHTEAVLLDSDEHLPNAGTSAPNLVSCGGTGNETYNADRHLECSTRKVRPPE